jgi:hypothetical protein
MNDKQRKTFSSIPSETITWLYILSTANTPLHIAALLGHAEFAMVVMQCCPHLPFFVFLLIRHVHASFKETIYTQPR